MRPNKISFLLAILVSVGFLATSIPIFAFKPVATTNDWPSWPANMMWGAQLLLENNTSGGSFFGVSSTTTDNSPSSPAPPQPYLWMVFRGGSPVADQVEITLTNTAAPQHLTWYTKFLYSSGNADTINAKVWANLENAANLYIPAQYSVILENTSWSPSTSLNMRLYTSLATGATISLTDSTTKYATLYVDNAARIENFVSSATTGWTGDVIQENFDIANNGRVTDNYAFTISSGGWTVSSLSNTWVQLAAGSRAHVTFNVTVGSGSVNTSVLAAGAYASDNSSVIALSQLTGPRVSISIAPTYSENVPGTNDIKFTVSVTNVGTVTDNYDLTIDNTQPWPRWIDNTTLYNLAPLATKTTILHENIPISAVANSLDNLGVTATSEYNNAVSARATTQLRAKASVAVGENIITARPDLNAGYNTAGTYQENWPGNTINPTYDVAITNKGVAADNFDVTLTDSLGWGPYFTDIGPINDVYVDSANPTLTYNTTRISVGKTAAGAGPKRSFLMFDLSEIPSGVTILSAKLQLVWYSLTVVPSNLPVNVSVRSVDNDSWIEGPYTTTSGAVTGNVTWNNQPALGPVIGTIYIDNYGPGYVGGVFTGYYDNSKMYKSVDVTSWVLSQRSLDNIASFALENDNLGNTTSMYFGAKEYWFGGHGEWIPSLSLVLSAPVNHMVVHLAAGENTTLSFTVKVSNSALPPTVDNITVTAASQSDPTANTSVIVQAGVKALASDIITVSPSSQIADVHAVSYLVDPCYEYDPLTYLIAVKNTGLLDDKKVLTATDNTGTLGLKLTPSELFIPAGDTEYASLSVTLPNNWVAGQSARLTVTATGMLSMQNDVNIYPVASDNSATVTAGQENSVQIEILPDNIEPQTGAPGSPLAWLVVIKNTGNAPENLTWSVSSADGWGATLDSMGWVMVQPCTKVTNWLRENVSPTAKTSTWDNITVTIAGTGVASKTYTVQVHAVEPGPNIPEGVIEISVQAKVIALELWPNQWVVSAPVDETDNRQTTPTYFTVRNSGNVTENISIQGMNAMSMPGEPVTQWTLASSIGVNQYVMKVLPSNMILTTSPQPLITSMASGTENTFGLWMQAPSVITVPARMWIRVKLTAVLA